jgi:DNA repair protein RadC
VKLGLPEAVSNRSAPISRAISTVMSQNDPHYIGHRRRLRERFLKSGLDGFADYEVVELLLTLAVPRSDVKSPAKALIARFGNLRAVLDAPIDELRAVDGIGSVTPTALKIIKAAATLYLQQASEGRDSLADASRLADFWRMRIGALPNEVFQVAYLDSSYRVLRDGVETLEEGTIDRAAVFPRRVMESALRRGAAALVLAHNHPNGHTAPSEHDKMLTRAIVLAAETVGVRIVDHLIVSATETYSFRKAGLL